MQQVTIGALYYATARLLYEYPTKVNPTNMWIALFAMMFGAVSAGNASAFGPDVNKAHTAGIKIFMITEHPSAIDVLAEPEQSKNEVVQVKQDAFQGEIEFRDVWFRYPTRRD